MIILASASPRRAELLRQLDIRFQVLPADIDESQQFNESPAEYVQRMAREKAQAVFHGAPQHAILGSDTAVVCAGTIFGKPGNYEDFLACMRQLSGETHQVMTAIALMHNGSTRTAISVTEVSFRVLQEAEFRNYWQTGEPKDKAGGYAIQGLAASFVERIAGSYSGVMGLPLYETAELLKESGLWALDEAISKPEQSKPEL